ncbi:MAG: YicC/YloC family endoribonuclease [Candidatus Cloacimonas sp.]
MKSMTGYGNAHIFREGIDIDIEIKSINGRFLDIRYSLPRELSFLEATIRHQAEKILSRGTIEIKLYYNDHREPRLYLDRTKLLKYNELAIQAITLLASDEIIPIEFLLQEPGVIASEDRLADDVLLADIIKEALNLALQKINESLSKEGCQIKDVLFASLQKMDKIIAEISTLCEPYKKELFQNMHKHIEELLGEYSIENLEQRIMQETAIYVDKYDINEEISRLRAHITTFQNTLQETGDIGKTLNFIIQEMQREANTMGSKFSTSKSFPLILTLKEEIEKCREIIQNVA